MDDRIRAHLARGERDAAASLTIRTYGPGVLGYLCSLLEEDDARDAFSLFAEHVWRGLAGFRGEGSIRAWLYRVAWNAAARLSRDAYRRRRHRLRTSVASRLAATITTSSGDVPGGRHDRLRRLRAGLTAEERTLLVLRVDRELEWEEVADVLSPPQDRISAAALRKRFERLKAKLAALALEQGLVGG